MAHVKSGSGHLAQKFRKIRNVMDKPDPYMAWTDERSLLTQKTKKKKGVIKVSDLGTEKERSIERTTSNMNEAGIRKLKELYLSRRGGKFPARQLGKGAY